jgi:hypothetical protein
MSPPKAIALGIVFNVITVVGMERVKHLWKGAPPVFASEPWLWYGIIAVTIVVTQFCLIVAALAEGFPMYVAIGIVIAFVLTGATLNGCWMSGRWPTTGESFWLLTLIAVTFVFQYVSSNAEKAHVERKNATAQKRDA